MAASSPPDQLTAVSEYGIPFRGAARGSFECYGEWIEMLAFSFDGNVVAGGLYGAVKCWSLEANCNPAHPPVPTETLASESDVVPIWLLSPIGALGQVMNPAFSPDNGLRASASNDGTIKLWDPVIEAERSILKGHSAPVRILVFSPIGHLLASGSDDHTVRLWDPMTGTPRNVLEGHFAPVWKLTFSSSGKLLASGSSNGEIMVWDSTNGTLCSAFDGPSALARIPIFSLNE
jgi:WD40 repeat protein